ncbi:hypothetical protein [Ottowia sp. VDI28]|uniref:hypothetical protein n=1 Tax=Ottowia sp. VDI28 TaxID=3133968 RepID=UPI003C2D35A1
MKRTGFKRKELPPRAPVVYAPLAKPANYARVSAKPAASVKKDKPFRSKTYRKIVASLPCICCGMPGISQCAHTNTGKGTGLKTSDLDSFPLCSCQPRRRGCHSKFDQGALFTKAERQLIEPAWVADTQRRIQAMGLWPKGIPLQLPNEASA